MKDYISKRYAIVLNGDLDAPHLRIYTKIFDEKRIHYDIISWDRNGSFAKSEFIYSEKTKHIQSSLRRLLSYFRYSLFIKHICKKYNYNKIVVISPQVALFIPFFLKRHYRGKYIFDYRDLSIEQMLPFKPLMRMVLSNSYANIISSPGFKKYLPHGYDYILSHNFSIDLVKEAIKNPCTPLPQGVIKVLTIGAIRFDANYEVIDSLGNEEGIELDFVGKGGAAPTLQKYCEEKLYNNIVFSGKYEKKDECQIIKKHTFINIFYPNIPSHVSALSNRFYNSLINKRPMIVTKGGEQGNYVEKYGVGLAVESCNGLAIKLKDYYNSFDFAKYEENCNKLLCEFIEDYEIFWNKLDAFIDTCKS